MVLLVGPVSGLVVAGDEAGAGQPVLTGAYAEPAATLKPALSLPEVPFVRADLAVVGFGCLFLTTLAAALARTLRPLHPTPAPSPLPPGPLEAVPVASAHAAG